MALDFSRFNFTFGQGLDTKSDPKQLQPGKLLALENGLFHETGAINKRPGYTALSREVDGGDSVPNGQALSTYRDELLQFAGGRAYSRIAATNHWSDRGVALSLIPSQRQVSATGQNQENPDLAISASGGIEVYAYEAQAGGIRFTVIDRETGATLVADQSVTPWGSHPRVTPIGDFVIIFFSDAGAIKFRALNVATPTVLQPEVVFASGLLGEANVFDVLSVPAVDRVYLGWITNSGGTLKVDYLDSSLSLHNSPTNAFGLSNVHGLTLWTDASSNIWFGLCEANYVRVLVATSALSLFLIKTVAIFDDDEAISVTGVETSPGVHEVYFDRQSEISDDPLDRYVQRATIDLAGNITPSEDFKRSVSLYSRAFAHDGRAYVVTSHVAAAQNTYFIINDAGVIVAKLDPWNAGPHRSNGSLASVSSLSFATLHANKLISGEDDTNDDIGTRRVGKAAGRTLYGVRGYSVSFDSALSFQTAELGNTLHVIGGIVQTYDGSKLVEENFNVYPDATNAYAEPDNVGGEAFPQGTYQYVLTYEATDNNGNTIRSMVSLPLKGAYRDGEFATPVFTPTVSISEAGASSVTVNGPTLRLTARDHVRICIYRTEANGSRFYRVTSITSPLLNDSTVDTFTYVDSVSDEDLIEREPLYTDGGVLDAASPPSASLITTYKNRLWLAGLEEEQTLWFSRTVFPNEGVAFSPLLTVRMDQRGGRITAIASLNDDLIIFKQTAIFRISGDGPNNLGQGALFSEPQLVTTDVGCSNANTIALTDQGLVFQAGKGIHLLDRSLSIQYIGAAVESFNTEEITSTTLVASQSIVIFTTRSDQALIWDYYFNQWGTFTNHASVDSIMFGDALLLLKADGAVWQQTSGEYTDDGERIRLKLTTGFLNLAGLLGFKKVRGLAVLGSYKGPHQLKIGVHWDFNDRASDLYLIDPSSVAGNTWGSGATWGSDPFFGGDFSPYLFIIPQLGSQSHPATCTSIAISLEDVQTDDFNQGLSLSGFALEVGIKKGRAKVPAGRMFG